MMARNKEAERKIHLEAMRRRRRPVPAFALLRWVKTRRNYRRPFNPMRWK